MFKIGDTVKIINGLHTKCSTYIVVGKAKYIECIAKIVTILTDRYNINTYILQAIDSSNDGLNHWRWCDNNLQLIDNHPSISIF